MIMEILLLIQKSPSNVIRRRTSMVSSKYISGLRVNVRLGKFDQFYYNLSLETGFLALKLTQNCYIGKYKYMLFLKTGILILNWVPLSFFYNHPIPERLSSQSILPNSLVNWEQFGSTT